MEKFKPKPGQVDLTNARFAPVINCVLKFKDKILMVRRSGKLSINTGLWHCIAGFLDDNKTLEEKALEEIIEETGLTKENIVSIKRLAFFETEQEEYNKTWIIHPVVVEVNTDNIKLDWEADNYQWLSPKEALKLQLVPGFERILKNLGH